MIRDYSYQENVLTTEACRWLQTHASLEDVTEIGDGSAFVFNYYAEKTEADYPSSSWDGVFASKSKNKTKQKPLTIDLRAWDKCFKK